MRILDRNSRHDIEHYILKGLRRSRFAAARAIRYSSKLKYFGDDRLENYISVLTELHSRLSRIESDYEELFGWKLEPVESMCNKGGEWKGVEMEDDVLDYGEMLKKIHMNNRKKVDTSDVELDPNLIPLPKRRNKGGKHKNKLKDRAIEEEQPKMEESEGECLTVEEIEKLLDSL